VSVAQPARAVLRLPIREKWEVLVALGITIVVELGLKFLTLPRLANLVGVPLVVEETPPGRPMTTPFDPWARKQLELAYVVLKHWPAGSTCLRRSLVAGNRLRRLDPLLRVGVAKDGTMLLAHAWLEIDGCFFDPLAAEFATITSVPKRKA
jgi:hypothetical protein